MSENTYQALDEAHWNTLWHKHGRLKPGQTPPPYPGAQRTGKNTLAQKVEKTMTHPLNKAVRKAAFCASDWPPFWNDPSESQNILGGILKEASLLSGCFPQRRLARIAATAFHWLLEMGVRNPWQAMCDDYEQQKMAWNGPKNLDHSGLSDKTRYLRMIAQLGKIAYTLDDDQVVTADTVAPEITRLGAYALAWLAHEIRKETEK